MTLLTSLTDRKSSVHISDSKGDGKNVLGFFPWCFIERIWKTVSIMPHHPTHWGQVLLEQQGYAFCTANIFLNSCCKIVLNQSQISSVHLEWIFSKAFSYIYIYIKRWFDLYNYLNWLISYFLWGVWAG